MAACASVLTGTAMVLPAATFADSPADPPPIVSLGVAGTSVDVPDLGVPLPNVEVSTEDLPLAGVTDAVGLTAVVDTAPQASDQAPASDVPPDEAPTISQPDQTAPVSDVPSDEAAERPSSGRSTPATAISTAPPAGSRLVTSTPTVDQAVVTGVLEVRNQRQIDQRAAVRAAQVLGSEKAAPLSKAGLGLAAPLTDLGSRGGVDTLNLASRNGPNSATGDWSLLPEVLYAVIPLLLAGAAVVAHNRRNARVAAVSIGVVRRRRHAGS